MTGSSAFALLETHHKYLLFVVDEKRNVGEKEEVELNWLENWPNGKYAKAWNAFFLQNYLLQSFVCCMELIVGLFMNLMQACVCMVHCWEIQ